MKLINIGNDTYVNIDYLTKMYTENGRYLIEILGGTRFVISERARNYILKYDRQTKI